MFQLLAAISVVMFLAAAPPYILDTVHGKTKPERATWLIYSILNTVAFVSQVTLGGGWSLVFLGLDTLGSMIVLGLSLRFGVGGWTLLDRIALMIASLGVVAAVFVHQPVVAILGVILADISGTVLTVLKTFHAPDSETTISWLLTGTGAVTGILAVGKFDIALLLYPTYLMLANYAVPVTQVLSRTYWQTHKRTPRPIV